MKQIVQDLKQGHTILQEVPAPGPEPGRLLVRTHWSLVSPGTERMLLDFGRAGWITKARQQPERLRQVIDKARRDGLGPTIRAVRSKLAQPLALGYSSAGEVIAVGAGVRGFAVGDRVATNGPHAEFASVPQHLAARIPEGVSGEAAAFTVLGAIALQGIRLAAPTFGETVVVSGLGLIGQLAAQLLRAAGCRVIGLDSDAEKRRLLESQGMEALDAAAANIVEQLLLRTGGIGVDATIIAAATGSSEPVSVAAKASRKRGRIVLVGVTGLQLNRSDFYEKELSFQVSCSYGPGRYDPAYEQGGQDYPIGFVRWTEQRNFEAVLAAMAAGQLNVTALVTQRQPLAAYQAVYDSLGKGGIATLLQYDAASEAATTVRYEAEASAAKGAVAAGCIGAGAFTQAVLLPALGELGVPVRIIASAKGLSAGLSAKRFGIAAATTDWRAVLEDPAVQLVFITTRHADHASMAAAALAAGKHVFVEKPLALTEAELQVVEAAYRSGGGKTLLHVGFNRRFAPLAVALKRLLPAGTASHSIITVNAGEIAASHWIRDAAVGGGRLLGEACHFIDLAQFLAGAPIVSVLAASPDDPADPQHFHIQLQLANGSTAAIHYLSGGAGTYPKERIEVHGAGTTLVLDNWRKLSGWGVAGFSSRSSGQDKGHLAQIRQLLGCIREGRTAPIPFGEILNSTRATLAAAESLRSRQWITIS